VATGGSWAVRAIVPDATGRLFYCVASGTPGTWKEEHERDALSPSVIEFDASVAWSYELFELAFGELGRGTALNGPTRESTAAGRARRRYRGCNGITWRRVQW
jgi:hypothetical protein